MVDVWVEQVAVDELRAVPVRWMRPPGWAGGTAVVLAPGAGAPMDHPFLRFVQEGLAARGVLAVSFDFPYQAAGRRAPDRAPVLAATWRAVWRRVQGCRPGCLVLGGKSMGGRIAAQVAAEGVACDGLCFLGYPLHPPGRTERLRDAPLRALRQPLLFVQGERDRLCDLGLLREVLAGLAAPVRLEVVAEGDHGFKVPKRSGRSEAAVWASVVAWVAGWLETLTGAALQSSPSGSSGPPSR